MSSKLSDYDYPLPEAQIARRPLPLPPSIVRESELADNELYQTGVSQSPRALAPVTGWLHFTAQILSEIPHAFVPLHVGPDTFRPVDSENVVEHRMHAESFSIS